MAYSSGLRLRLSQIEMQNNSTLRLWILTHGEPISVATRVSPLRPPNQITLPLLFKILDTNLAMEHDGYSHEKSLILTNIYCHVYLFLLSNII